MPSIVPPTGCCKVDNNPTALTVGFQYLKYYICEYINFHSEQLLTNNHLDH